MNDTTQSRIASLDVLRGFALMGILLMNIQLFAMPTAAYINPYAYGDMQGVNFVVWSFNHLFADQKFMTLFSVLFGAGILVFCQNAVKKGHSAASLHYQRNFWLMVFGLIHGYLLWHGDILFSYALCAFVVFLFRNQSVTTLVVSGLVMISIASLLSLATGFAIPYIPAEGIEGMTKSWKPTETAIQHEIAAYTGGFSTALAQRTNDTVFMQSYMFLNYFFWRAGGLMLIGMALFKAGFFALRFSVTQYACTALICATVGFAVTIYGVEANLKAQFSLEYSMFIGSQFNYWGSLLVSMAYACIIMIMVKQHVLMPLQKRLAMIGKTAFSNYIFHTLACSVLFYFAGYMGQFERAEQLLTVFIIYGLQLILTPLWLKHYQYGPLEWLWRSLTYRQFQPMKQTQLASGY